MPLCHKNLLVNILAEVDFRLHIKTFLCHFSIPGNQNLHWCPSFENFCFKKKCILANLYIFTNSGKLATTGFKMLFS